MPTYVVKSYHNGAGNTVGPDEFEMTTIGSDDGHPVQIELVQLRLLEALTCNLASIAESLDLINQTLSDNPQASTAAPLIEDIPF